MKQIRIILSIAFLTLISFQIEAQHNHGSHDHSIKTKSENVLPMNSTTDIIMVYGNCGMCKKRIESSLSNVKGVHSAIWNVETKVLTIKYNKEVILMDDIKKRVSKAGHDTNEFFASQIVYNALPGCCQYERPAQIK